MIGRYNRSCTLQAAYRFCLSLISYGITAWVVQAMLERYGVAGSGFLTFCFCGTISLIGWRRWQAGLGYRSYSELSFSPDDAAYSPYTQRRSMSFVRDQFLLSGPLQALKGIELIRSRIPEDGMTETRMQGLLDSVRAKGSWHSMSEWAGQEKEILGLVRMGRIEFSMATALRIKKMKKENS